MGKADVRVLAAPDAFLHTVAHGMTSGPSLRWIVDAWFLLERHALFDWATLLETTRASRLELPLARALKYLADELRVPVPTAVLAALDEGAARTSAAGRAAARVWPSGRAFPPPLQFALYYGVPLWTVPYYYLYRLARHGRSRSPDA
jgi:hypothetical protein